MPSSSIGAGRAPYCTPLMPLSTLMTICRSDCRVTIFGLFFFSCRACLSTWPNRAGMAGLEVSDDLHDRVLGIHGQAQAGVGPDGQDVEVVEVLPGGAAADAVVEDAGERELAVRLAVFRGGRLVELPVRHQLGLAVDGQEVFAVRHHHVVAYAVPDDVEFGFGPQVDGGQDPRLAEDDPLDVPAVAGDVLGLVAGQGPLDERVDVPLLLDFVAVEGGALGPGLQVDRVPGDGAQLLEGGGDQENGRARGRPLTYWPADRSSSSAGSC